MSPAAKAWLAGGIALGVAVFVIVIVLAARSGGSRRNDTGTYTLHLPPGLRDARAARFVEGRLVTISVTSDQFTNVGLHVFDSRGLQVASHNGPGGNCFLNFVPPRTDSYRIEVVNHGPAFSRCVVSYH
jgi:hypothetical protein